MNTSEAVTATDSDPAKYFWYLVYGAVMAVTAVPLFGDLDLPQVLDRMTLLVIHEFAGFLFVGHTFFSNIWAMRIRIQGSFHQLHQFYLRPRTTPRQIGFLFQPDAVLG